MPIVTLIQSVSIPSYSPAAPASTSSLPCLAVLGPHSVGLSYHAVVKKSKISALGLSHKKIYLVTLSASMSEKSYLAISYTLRAKGHS
jgi:hypothetical protein